MCKYLHRSMRIIFCTMQLENNNNSTYQTYAWMFYFLVDLQPQHHHNKAKFELPLDLLRKVDDLHKCHHHKSLQ